MKYNTDINPFALRMLDPERMYIKFESYFLSVLQEFKNHNSSLVKFKQAYALLYETDFKLDDIKALYEIAWKEEIGYYDPNHDNRWGVLDDFEFINCKKITYLTKVDAVEDIKRRNEHRRNEGLKPLTRAYHCLKCNNYHLTTESAKLTKLILSKSSSRGVDYKLAM